MEKEKTMHGFSVLEERRVEELKADLCHMRHERTGLELVWLKREEENKSFGIAFQTIPEDDTGVFHILEHSVLCGSEGYPLKEPFVELLKHSMNTFLNAMTFPDKTCYPVSSRNDKDFFNLMRVYLDAVFRPLIYRRREVFEQEGWHYELDSQGKPSYKGVVFNEMKGAYADVDQLAARAVCQSLFPDTCYRFEAGGDPAAIPDLTYQSFLERHRRFYSPSNAYVFLDGAVDIDRALAILDGEYLSAMERGERLAPPALQAPLRAGERRVEFELPPEEEGEKRCRLVWASVVGSFDQIERLTAMQVLAAVLCRDNQAPLNRAVLDQGLAESVSLQLVEDVAQPWVQMEARNLAEEDRDRVEEALFTALERLAREGLDRRQMEAALANMEFQMRERDYGAIPQGLAFGLNIVSSWMRGGDPAANLEVGDLFEKLRAKLDQGYFEDLLREVLLEAPHSCKVLLVPSPTAGEARRQAEAGRLARESARWSQEERQALMARQRDLEEWQRQADPPERLALLPHLERADLPEEPPVLPTQVERAGETALLRHELAAGGVVYWNLYFDVEGCTEEELSCLSFLCQLLGKVDTVDHRAEELGNRARLLCGNMSFALPVYEAFGEPGRYQVKLRAGLSALEHNQGAALELMAELLTGSVFRQEREIRDILRQSRMQMFQQLVLTGHTTAMGRVEAQISPAAVVQERVGGFAYYQWLKEQEERGDWPRLRAELEGLCRRVFCREGLTVSVTGLPGGGAAQRVEDLAGRFPARLAGEVPASPIRPWGALREGIELPSDVAYAAMGGSLLQAGAAPSGVWKLAARVVSLSYLWNVIRVQGGAYGTGLAVREGGFAGCYSYRDPDGARSLDCYRRAAEVLAEFCAGEPDLTGFIIGAISDGEPLLSPRLKGLTADSHYWRGLTWERRCQLRRELLSASPQDLAALAAPLGRALDGRGVCVAGPREPLERCGLERILTL